MANLLFSINKGANQVKLDYIFRDNTLYFSLLQKKNKQTLAHIYIYITLLLCFKTKLNQ